MIMLQEDETDFMKGRVIEMTEAELKENFVQVRTPDKERIARITKGLIGEQCQQLKRYWHLPRIKNQTRFQRK